ncbi:hypothetical protein QBC42DRAFT_189805, partial [Cladorrhinum samala]
HNKAECPNPAKPKGACRRCNQEGHWSKECPNAPPQACNGCGSTEHLRRECPTSEPLVCKQCGSTEHTISHAAATCQNARVINRDDIEDKTIDEAWEMIAAAVTERDIDDIKHAVQVYIKANPTCTYQNLQKAFRQQGTGIWLVALEKPNAIATLTNMDLQGKVGKKYTVTYRLQFQPQRPREREGWPKSEEENYERLADAGELVPSYVPKCKNCDELGHMARSCPQEKVEVERVLIKCYNCDEVGHRVRDCPTPRVDKFACKNCGKPGHKIVDCPEPRSAEGVECRKCNEMGHFSKDCPKAGPRGCRNCGQEGHISKECTEPRNPANIQCRNCDEMGHTGKECPKPRDMSRVKCMNCQEMGHFKTKCPNPIAAEEDAGDLDGAADGGVGGFDAGGGGGGDDWQTTAAASGGDAGGW